MDLLRRIRDSRPENGVVLWWLGQAGVLIKGASATVVVDAYLTDHGRVGRRYEPPLHPHEITDADLLLGTHDHLDHIDPEGLPTMAMSSPRAVVVVPRPAVARVIELGVPADRVEGAQAEVPLDFDGIRVIPVPGLHAPSPERGYAFHRDEDGRYPFLGYAIEIDGVRMCHLGDTLVYDGLGERLRELDLDVLLLPINGRSWYREQRGIVGNMNVFEAAELAAVSCARRIVPVHWDLFADNAEDPEHFQAYVREHFPSVKVEIPRIGTSIAIASIAGTGTR
jgi:L-ascorbate metabolism protein UlaG (beta-lactamase superfamily)